jgi:chorismate mutase / prephenate dehydratase
MSGKELVDLRMEINEIDEKIIELFKMRMQVVKEIANYKIANNLQVLDESREEFIIKKHTDNVNDPELKNEIGEFIRCLLKISRDVQEEVISSYRR